MQMKRWQLQNERECECLQINNVARSFILSKTIFIYYLLTGYMLYKTKIKRFGLFKRKYCTMNNISNIHKKLKIY